MDAVEACVVMQKPWLKAIGMLRDVVPARRAWIMQESWLRQSRMLNLNVGLNRLSGLKAGCAVQAGRGLPRVVLLSGELPRGQCKQPGPMQAGLCSI